MGAQIVSTQAQLLSALHKAQGGETIYLADGNYGQVTLEKKYASDVTISSLNAQGAVFDRFNVKGGAHINVDGIQAKAEFRATGNAEDISVTNVKTAAFYFRDVDGLKIDHSESSGSAMTLILNDTRNFSITNSHFHDATEDVSRITGKSAYGLFENNIFSDTNALKPLHPDLMQFFNVGTNTPHDIVIRGNLFYDDIRTGNVGAQGIFLGDASGLAYRNILIEENLISVGSPNSIYVNGGQENVVIRHNTLIAAEGTKGGTIRLAEKSGFDNSGTTVEGNIARSIVNETDVTKVSENWLYNTTKSSEVFSGEGSHWSHYELKNGPAPGLYGASAKPTGLETAEVQVEAVPPVAEAESKAAPQEIYGFVESKMFSGNMDGRVIQQAHTKAMEIDEGTIALSFNADNVGWRRGLISKESSTTGDHFGIWIQDGTLRILAGDGQQEKTISIGGIAAHKTYDLMTSFDESGVDVWLNGQAAGHIAIDMDWSQNKEALVIGANNGASAPGTTSTLRYLFDGDIKDLAIHDQAMTPEDLQAHFSSMALV